MTNLRHPRPRIAEPVCVRYQGADVEIIEAAMAVMGSATISEFIRSASVALAKAIIEADIRQASWDACRIEGSIERKP